MGAVVERLQVLEMIAGFKLRGRLGYPEDYLRLKLARFAGAFCASLDLTEQLEPQERDLSPTWRRTQSRLHSQERQLMFFGLESYCRIIKARIGMADSSRRRDQALST